jgi:2-hydroxychromene-2-carboxylate isomerase
MKKLELYFDFLSPFSYVALKKWQASNEFWMQQNVQIVPKPVSMIPLIKSWETKGPAEIAPKRDYLMRQLLRQSQKEGITFRTPHHLPFMSLPMLRMVAWSQVCAADKTNLLIQVLADAAWALALDIEDDQVLCSLWTKCGISIDLWQKLPLRENRKIAQEILRENVAMAQKNQAFGVPTWVWQGELFWGADAIDDLMDVVAGKDSLDRMEYQRYLDVIDQRTMLSTQDMI